MQYNQQCITTHGRYCLRLVGYTVIAVACTNQRAQQCQRESIHTMNPYQCHVVECNVRQWNVAQRKGWNGMELIWYHVGIYIYMYTVYTHDCSLLVLRNICNSCYCNIRRRGLHLGDNQYTTETGLTAYPVVNYSAYWKVDDHHSWTANLNSSQPPIGNFPLILVIWHCETISHALIIAGHCRSSQCWATIGNQP